MMTAKFAGAWIGIILAVAFVIVGPPYYALASCFGIISIAFSQAPPNYR